MNYKKILLYLIIFLTIFALGGVSGFLISKNKIKIDKDEIISDCWENARKELVGTCTPPSQINKNTPVTNFYGKLLEIKSDQRQIVIDPAPLEDGEDNISSLIIEIDSDAKIEQIIKKDDTEYQNELDEFNENFKTNENIAYPLQYTNKLIDFSAFQIGQNITIKSKDDVRNAKSIKAINVIINFSL